MPNRKELDKNKHFCRSDSGKDLPVSLFVVEQCRVDTGGWRNPFPCRVPIPQLEGA